MEERHEEKRPRTITATSPTAATNTSVTKQLTVPTKARTIPLSSGAAAIAKAAATPKRITATITVESVSAEFVVLGGLDLSEVASRCINTEAKGSGGLVEIRLKKPRILFRVHAKGKVIAMGAASEAEAAMGCRRLARLFQKRLSAGSTMRFRKYKINNIMAAFKPGGGIVLDRFYSFHRNQFASNDLEYFSDLHNHIKLNLKNKFGIRAKLQLWASGAVKIYAPSLADLTNAVKALVPMMEQFRTDATSAFLARRKATRGFPLPRLKKAEVSSSSCSSEDEADGGGSSPSMRDAAEIRAKANKRKKREFVKKHTDRVWTKWAKFGKHAFIDDDDDDDGSDDDDDDNNNNKRKKKCEKKEKSSYAVLDSSDED